MLPMQRRTPVRNIWRDPFEAFDREIIRALGGLQNNDSTPNERLGSYPVDIHEDDDHVYVDAELPGFNKDEVDITLESGVLTISAERNQEPKQTEHLTERRYTRVQRSFTLPTSVDDNAVEANLVEGVLKLKLTKHAEVKPRKIKVS